MSAGAFVAKNVKNKLASPPKKESNANQIPSAPYAMFFSVVSMSFVVPAYGSPSVSHSIEKNPL
jgi:hypothetical protein